MPLYEYRCSTCDKITEQFVSIKEAEEKITCGHCGAPAYRILSVANWSLRGNKDGWYKPAADEPKPKPASGGPS